MSEFAESSVEVAAIEPVKPAAPILEDFKNIHQGQDIYVMGSGKSCDFLDPSFFENKICIGINQAYKKYNCQYLVKKDFVGNDGAFDYARDNDATIFYSQKAMGTLHNTDPTKHMKKGEDASKIKTIMFKHPGMLYHDGGYDTIKKIYAADDNKLMISFSTITSGIHLAFYMGAKNIILVGHDCCFINKQTNYDGYHTEQTMKPAWGGMGKEAVQNYANWVSPCADISNRIKRLLKEEYNVNLCAINPFPSLREAINRSSLKL